MKILFLNWKSYGNEDIKDAVDCMKMDGEDIELIMYPFDNHIMREDKEFDTSFTEALKDQNPDFVMSFNYFPAVSQVCNAVGIKYAAWVYDNPSLNLFSYTLINPCNYVFLFDSQVYELFASQGFKTVYYLPLAAPIRRYDLLTVDKERSDRWGGKISFVGKLYNEDHNYFDRVYSEASEYTRGYLNGLMRAQMEISGFDIVEKSIPEKVMHEMVDILGAKPSYDGVETYEYIYSNYVINRKITSIERSEIIQMIGKRFPINLYTPDDSFKADGVSNRGKVDYYLEMPYVFKASDINLNITLRSIQRGIPLRAMDIMGCEGFLLTNYQEDMLRYFIPEEDFVYYEDRNDLMDKIGYYLIHDEERERIAENAYNKVSENHTYEHRLREIIDKVLN